MRSLITIIVPLLVVVLLSACSSSVNNTGAGTTKFPEGKELYVAKCTACHRAYEPEQHTKEEWQKQVEEMGSKAKLSETEKQLILSYLLENK